MTYFRLRSYLPADHPDKALEIGLEQTPAEFIAALVDVFREVRRVLRRDGVLFVNLADSYAGSGKGPSGHNGIGDQEQRQGFVGSKQQTNAGSLTGGNHERDYRGIPAKNLLLVPERFAIAMCDDGWIVRDQIVWAKRAPMPESVRDRCTKAWEPIWMFTRQGRYFWDAEAVRTPLTDSSVSRLSQPYVPGAYRAINGAPTGNRADEIGTGANLRNVWHLGPEPSREQHYAAYPTEIPRRCILAATSERGQCPACGAPYIRISERPSAQPHVDPSSLDRYGTGEAGVHRKVGGQYQKWLDANPKQTTGWSPSCQCKDAGDPVPQTVLDPFLGTGTTLLAAKYLGRAGLGIELNPEYAEIARRRIATDVPKWTHPAVAEEKRRADAGQPSLWDLTEAAS